MVERSLIACNGIEVIGDCIYETKLIKQQQQQKQQRIERIESNFNALYKNLLLTTTTKTTTTNI